MTICDLSVLKNAAFHIPLLFVNSSILISFYFGHGLGSINITDLEINVVLLPT